MKINIFTLQLIYLSFICLLPVVNLLITLFVKQRGNPTQYQSFFLCSHDHSHFLELSSHPPAIFLSAQCMMGYELG